MINNEHVTFLLDSRRHAAEGCLVSSRLHQTAACGTIRLSGGAREDVAHSCTGATQPKYNSEKKVEREINRVSGAVGFIAEERCDIKETISQT